MRWIGRALSTLVLLGLLALMWPTTLGGATAYVKVSGRSMLPKLHDGDLVVTRAVDHYDTGDVIAYRVPDGQVGAGQLVVHRIVGGSPARGFRTRGDNRDTDDLWRPRVSDILGEKWIVVPGAGRAMGSLRSPLLLAGFAAVLAVSAAVALIDRPGSRRRLAEPDGEESEPQVILVVDDQSAFRRGVARMLIDSGYAVREAADGRSAAIAADANPQPALVLCDVGMPGMSGPDVLDELSKNGLHKGVLMSGRAPDTGTAEWPFLRKPFLEADLLELVRHELEETSVEV